MNTQKKVMPKTKKNYCMEFYALKETSTNLLVIKQKLMNAQKMNDVNEIQIK